MQMLIVSGALMFHKLKIVLSSVAFMANLFPTTWILCNHERPTPVHSTGLCMQCDGASETLFFGLAHDTGSFFFLCITT